jgi:hypothetical protein
VVGFCPRGFDPPAPLVGSVSFSACFSFSLAIIRVGAPVGAKRRYWIVRLSTKLLNVHASPQMNWTCGGRPRLPPPEPGLSCSSFISSAAMPMTLPSGMAGLKASKRRSTVSVAGWPPPYWTCGKSLPAAAFALKVDVFVIEYSLGLNQQCSLVPPSISR